MLHDATKKTNLVLIEREIGLQRPDEEWLGVADFRFRHLLLVLGPVGSLCLLHLRAQRYNELFCGPRNHSIRVL